MVETAEQHGAEADRPGQPTPDAGSGGGKLRRLADARIPTPAGEFRLYLYANGDGKEHLAAVHGDVRGQQEVLTRVHSECFTGDVLGSLRCDCGEQLERAMHLIGQEGRGVIVYLRQEGRGIGLLDKLRSYNLQDRGYDTVDANLLLGHEPDERDYGIAVEILADLGVGSVRLLTNNPHKIAALERAGVVVADRIPLQGTIGPENMAYLQTKARRMDHLLDIAAPDRNRQASGDAAQRQQRPDARMHGARPLVTLSYAQSLDGCIAARPGQPLRLSGTEAMRVTHRLRAAHDAILVGIGTVLADDPQLTVRLVEGRSPQPVIIDPQLRTPTNARLFGGGTRTPWLVAIPTADPDRRRELEAAGAVVLTVHATAEGRVDLHAMLGELHERGIDRLMVEGGARVITCFLAERLIDQMVVTIAPHLIGGLRALDQAAGADQPCFPRLENVRYEWLDGDIMLWGEPRWD